MYLCCPVEWQAVLQVISDRIETKFIDFCTILIENLDKHELKNVETDLIK